MGQNWTCRNGYRPAPLTMIETTIQLKPRDQWREGVTTESLRKEFDELVQFPG
ncbi:cobalt-zinc-cadmium resistance protein CzcA [Vibrio ponticus]|nr:cobalt-zinc-cadmium resistance protein CzcA [Vibrio ponticus]